MFGVRAGGVTFEAPAGFNPKISAMSC